MPDGIRYIHDVAGIGVVLSGTLAVSEWMSDRRVGINYEQIASRIGCRRTFSEKVEREDVKKILQNAAPGAPQKWSDTATRRRIRRGHTGP